MNDAYAMTPLEAAAAAFWRCVTERDHGGGNGRLPAHLLPCMEAACVAWDRSQWQPIETAPRDGTRVLFFAPPAKGENRGSVQRIDRWKDYHGWWEMRPGQPYTHWRILPEGPCRPQDAEAPMPGAIAEGLG